MTTHYLDNAATTPVSDAVKSAVLPFLGECFGNPSSRHPLGVAAAEAVDRARRDVARALGARPEDVLFTAGGTEANNLAVLGLARARAGHGASGRRASGGCRGHVLYGPTEHPSVAAPAAALAREGFDVERLRLDANGELDLDDLADKLRDDTVLVAQMLVNNEFGTIYPIERVARIVRAGAPNAYVHVDAIQGIGKVDVSLGELGVHSISISAHKIHGLKGCGALALVEGVQPEPLLHGGGQERGLRSGTENVVGIVALGVAARLASEARATSAAHMTALRERLRTGLEGTGARLLTPGASRSPAIAAVLVPGPPAEVWMHHLETHGVLVSAGSACQAKKNEPSPSLAALGLGDDAAKHVLRLSFSRETTVESIDAAVAAIVAIERELAQVSR